MTVVVYEVKTVIDHFSTVSYEELYAFSYNPKQNDQQREEGWQLIDLRAEYERMGVPCDQWQLTDVNRDFKVNQPVLNSDLHSIIANLSNDI